MRIGIMGAGGIGSVIGGLLSEGGHDITLIDRWREQIEKIKADGLIVETRTGEHLTHPKAIHIHELQLETEQFDAVFIAVKSYDTEWATTTMLNHVDPEKGVFVNFQNGINDERMAAIAGVERSLGCVITISAAVYEPGRALRTDDKSPGFKIAEQDGADTARARQLIEVMNSVELTEFSDDLWGERWSKLMINCMNNALSGLSGYGTAEVRTDNDARRTGIQLGAEVARVAGALGIRLHTVIGISPDAVIDAAEGHNLEEVESTLLDSARSAGTGGVPSFGQDVRKGRRTEIDYLNGYVSEKGREIGVPTPFNDRIVDIVHDLGLDFTGDPKHIQPLVEMLP
ncbi:MAG TPA: 2-dehydropantoate 2-reductase [Dehalococcoidia bacterium]|jgi:2-dehydropantoate 2-reductase|nr:2-dehydropantoate 2-reductase [Dehalococcoidia bacterium]